ncbi:MAG: hypothetical protein M1818_005458 [Claussenomyces sp. TS43310]|nr:MAG: hypothetical protein M1818_005458 [Claussenomyces sp. TS43310]
MVDMYPQQPWIVENWSRWHQLPCLLSDERLRFGFSASHGHLSDDSRVEAFLQGLLLFRPSAFLLTSAPVRIFQLYYAKLVTVPNYRGFIKAVSRREIQFHTMQELAYTAPAVTGIDTTLLAARLLSLVAYAAFCVLSILEHGRSITPSTILTVYLVFSAFFDTIQFGLLYVAKSLCSPSALSVAIFLVRLALLVIEARKKTSILREPYQHLAPEETAGFLDTAFFWWVNDINALGYS